MSILFALYNRIHKYLCSSQRHEAHKVSEQREINDVINFVFSCGAERIHYVVTEDDIRMLANACFFDYFNWAMRKSGCNSESLANVRTLLMANQLVSYSHVCVTHIYTPLSSST